MFGYDHRGRRTTVTDQNNHVTTYDYDDADRLVSVTDAQTPAGITQYGYDNENNLTSITDAMQHQTQFQYDSLGCVTLVTFPSQHTESYDYDAIGNLQHKTDRKGQTVTYTYDGMNRLSQKSYPDSSAVNYTYDADNRLTQVSDTNGTYTFAYDNMGRLVGTTTQYHLPGASTLQFSQSYGYDAASNRTSATMPDNSTIAYVYDSSNRLTDLTSSWAQHFTFGYDQLNRTTSLNRPNTVNTSYTYDTISRVLSILHKVGLTTIDGAAYVYDGAGNRTSKTNQLNGITENYSYDPIYQLTQVMQGTTTTESYTYDAVGNRLSDAAGSAYTYNSSNELTDIALQVPPPQIPPPWSYSYDNNGNTSGKNVMPVSTTYSWDYENRMRTRLQGGVGTTYVYDPMGRRLGQGPHPNFCPPGCDLPTTYYVYDGANLVAEYDGSGNLTRRYVQGPGIDQPLAMSSGGTTSYFEADALGSITSLTGAAGAIAGTVVYDSFGNITSSSGASSPFQFTGREPDGAGLYYYRARYYDPQIGRFLSEDSMRFRATGTNFYPYVANNPALLVDPLGLCPQGTHAATPSEVAKILASAKDIAGEGLKYKDIKCNQFVDRSINKAIPGALSKEYTTRDIGQGQGPFEQTDSPAVGDLALFNVPGHVTLITQMQNGKVSQFVGSQSSTGPAYVNLPEYFWQGRLDAKGNVKYYRVCLPN